MGHIRIGSFNINGVRDKNKRAKLSEFMKISKIDIVMLQETHSDKSNEIEWGLWWEGKYALSHGSSTSAGVAVLFSKILNVENFKIEEVVAGRVLCVHTEIERIKFVFINVYAPNVGSERIELFLKIKSHISQYDNFFCIVMAGDWNCTEHFNVDRNSEEPHFQSGVVLSKLIEEHDLTDIWRNRNEGIKQYTWVKVSNNEVKGARLDRIYMSRSFNNRVMDAAIIPSGFSDHQIITIDINKKTTFRLQHYWHFNKKILYNKLFCESFTHLWENWRLQKNNYETKSQWWEVGKVHITFFCQSYESQVSLKIRDTVQKLQCEIGEMEKMML